VAGPNNVPITILIFSDFESFLCARSAAVLKGLLGDTADLRLVFKHAPAASNPNSMLAREASLAAGAQGKFWEMHDLLFENQSRLSRAELEGYAEYLGLNMSAFRQALDRHTYRPIIERDLVEASGLGVTATWTAALLFGLAGRITRSEFLWYYGVGQLFLFAAGAYSAGKDSGVLRATAASAKAAIVPVGDCILLSSVLGSLAFGFAGASTACIVRRLREAALRHS
jgi:Thioredoxin